jgi:predicted nucleic acid-binding Zn ribbon protein
MAPLYDFQCSKCKEVQEYLTNRSEATPRTLICEDEQCMGVSFRKVSETASPVFRGSGWTEKFY